MRFLLLLLSSAALAQSPSVSLTWSSAAAGTYTVYRGAAPCGGPYLKIMGGMDTQTFLDASVRPGGTYTYMVTVTVNGKESVPSNCLLLVIPSSTPPPPPAPVLQGTVNPS